MAKIPRAATTDVDVESGRTGGWALGTISNMSPEQALGRTLDERSDLFSFGTVLYEMATGLLPFRGSTTGTLFRSVVQERPVSALQLRPDLPAALEAIITRCLEKEREKRYHHAAEVRRDLANVQRALAPAARSNGDITVAGGIALARAGDQDFLALWKDADPDVPVLREARAEYAKLK